MKMVLVLSHGQATAERGFSVNKQVLEVNMQGKSLEAQRVICDEILCRGGILKQGPRSNFEIGGAPFSDLILGGGHKTLFLTNSL